MKLRLRSTKSEGPGLGLIDPEIIRKAPLVGPLPAQIAGLRAVLRETENERRQAVADLSEAREELEVATRLIVDQYNTLRGVGSKLGWLLFNHSKGNTGTAVRSLAIGALEILDVQNGTDYAEQWKGRRP